MSGATVGPDPLRASSLEWLLGDTPSPLRVRLSGPRSLGQALQEFAATSQTARPPGSDKLPKRIRENARRLVEAHEALGDWAKQGLPLPAESEWLLDNYYIVEEVAREIRRDLPMAYYRELPAIRTGPLQGVPRVYPLAAVTLTSTDLLPTESVLANAIAAFQEVATLTTGELWALPIMLRASLLESLRLLADEVIRSIEDGQEARRAARLAISGTLPPLPDAPRDAYAAAFLDALREGGDATASPVIEAIQDWVGRYATDLSAIRQREYLRQAANQVSIGNAITTLRLLGVIDWQTFIENVSGIERLLRTDPGGSYSRQDFSTRDRCRKAVEELAHGSKRLEADVVKVAIAAAKASNEDPVRGHVAFHLIGRGRRELERTLNYTPTGRAARRRWILDRAFGLYFGALIALTLGFLSLIFLVIGPLPLSWALLVVVVLFCGLLPGSCARLDVKCRHA